MHLKNSKTLRLELLSMPLVFNNDSDSLGQTQTLSDALGQTQTLSEALGQTQTPSEAPVYTDLGLEVTTIPTIPQKYKNSRYEYPCGPIDFSFAAADNPRVRNWYEGTIDGLTNGSTTALRSALSKAFFKLLDDYTTDCGILSAIVAPMRLGWAFRYANGKHNMPVPTIVVNADVSSPKVVDREHTISETTLTSVAEIRNTPVRLILNTADVTIPESVTHIDIVASLPVDLAPIRDDVTGLNSVDLDGTRVRQYIYTRQEASYLEALAAADTDLRVVASIPVDSLPLNDTPLEFTAGWMQNWKSLPKLTLGTPGNSGGNSGGNSSGDNDNESDDKPWEWPLDLNMTTPPLDLGLPEHRKRILSLTLRGVYPRGEQELDSEDKLPGVSIALYGSMHREEWHKVAEGTGGVLRPLLSKPYRWYKVAVTGRLRKGDELDALTFRFLPVSE